MHGPPLDPYMAGRGFASLAASVGNFSVVALFNNSPAQHVIRLWDIQLLGAGGVSYLFQMLRGTVGALLANSVSPLVGEERLPVGQIFTQQAATSPLTQNFGGWGGVNNVAYAWTHHFPIAVLPPGMSFVLATTAVNLALQPTLVWDYLDRGDLTAPTA